MVAVVQIAQEEASFQYKRAAAIDACKRNKAALENNPTFFSSRKPIQQQIEKLISKHYSITDARYINYRAGGKNHKPAIAIKISNPTILSRKLRALFADIDLVADSIVFQENVNTGAHIFLIH